MEQKRIKVRLTENSPYSEYGYYKKGDIGYIDGYVNGCAVIILENGKFAKAGLRWIEVVNAEDKNTNTELKESEDERIRKVLVKYFTSNISNPDYEICGVPFKEILAWLEKQGEQKPANWLRELEDKLANATPQQIAEWKEKYFKEEPAEWSEEDERIIEGLNNCLDELEKEDGWNYVYVNDEDIRLSKVREWFKSLKGRYTWKPSSEHIKALEESIEFLGCTKKVRDNLKSLYEQLKKLKD